jgi:transcriptional regulator with XRE-family HTH domain
VKAHENAEQFLADRLRTLRKLAGLTQEAFAEKAKFSYKYYQGIERGQWTNLRLRTLEKLSFGYGITLSELFATRTPKLKIKVKSDRRLGLK